jgi:hypothetical protein
MPVMSTDEAEGAQALFCFIADTLGSKETNREFKHYLNKVKKAPEFFETHKQLIDRAFDTNAVKTGKTKETIVKYIKENNDWFLSSLSTAQFIINEIDDISSEFAHIKKPGWQDLFYRHGDDEVMGVMSTLFKSANNQSAKQDGQKFFGDINKWTPADIYFASDKARSFFKKLSIDKETQNNNLTFAVLNKHVGEMIESGDLLPLSLKKVVKDVIIKKVNFSREDEEALLADTICTGIQPWDPMTGTFKYDAPNKLFELSEYSGGRDIYITLDSGKVKGRIQIRHTPSSGGRPQKGVKVILGYVGSSALGGQVVGIPLLTKIIGQVDPTFAKKLMTTWDRSYRKFEETAKLYNQYGGGTERYSSKDKQLKKQFNDDFGAISAITIMNGMRELIDDYFSNPKEKQHNVVRAIFAYTASRTINSSPFVIAKD